MTKTRHQRAYEKLKNDPARLSERRRRQVEDATRRRQSPQGWLRYALTAAKHRAVKAGLAFDLTIESVELPERCPVFGTLLRYDFVRERSVTQYNCLEGPSLDRVKCEEGYVKSNVRVVSQRANSLKSNGSIQEFQAIIQYMENHDGHSNTC